jgi:hypothetical protein
MGIVKSRAISRLRRYVSELKAVFIHDGRVLFCRACRKSDVGQQLSQVTEHLGGNRHLAGVVALKAQLGGQSLICESSDVSSFSESSKFTPFATDICKASMVAHVVA